MGYKACARKRGKAHDVRTAEFWISSIGGATNTLTFSSTSLYFAFPRTTCFPGAPVRCPPGRNACRVPVWDPVSVMTGS